VSEDASTAEVEAAVAQLAHVASALALTAPAQADALWLRIRQISRDLLSGDERRRVYDQALQGRARRERTSTATAAPPPVAMDSSVRPQASGRSVPAARPRRRWRSLAADLGVAVAVMAAVTALFFQPWNWGHVSPATPPLALSASGPQQGNAYRSGDTVQLHWSSLGPGTIYRLQIGRGTALADGAIAFVPPWRSILTDRTSYRFRALGAQFYFWRVRGLVSGHWHPWSSTEILAVAAPSVGVPAARQIRSGSILHPGRAKLCWTAVGDAAGYLVRVDGRAPISTRSTCMSVTFAAGTHHWQVAATTRGVKLYAGAYSAPATIRVVKRRTVSRATHVRRVGSAQTSSRRGGSGNRGSGNQGTIVVAAPSSVAAVYRSGSTSRHSSHRARSGRSAHATRQRRSTAQPVSPPPPPRVPAFHRIPRTAGNHPPPVSRPAPVSPPSPAVTATSAPQATPTSGRVFYPAVAPTPTATQPAGALWGTASSSPPTPRP
jgi:hypothetical protein